MVSFNAKVGMHDDKTTERTKRERGELYPWTHRRVASTKIALAQRIAGETSSNRFSPLSGDCELEKTEVGFSLSSEASWERGFCKTSNKQAAPFDVSTGSK